MNKAELIELTQKAQAEIDRERKEKQLIKSQKLAKTLLTIGIETTINEDAEVILFDEYTLSGDQYRLKIKKGGTTQEISSNYRSGWLARANANEQIGEAIIYIDQVLKYNEKNKQKPAYSYEGNSIGEILEDIIRDIAYEMNGQA